MATKKTDTPESGSQSPSGDVGEAEVASQFDEAEEKGYFGETPDDTPNENYTLKGVVADKPTPENQRGKQQ
jgi:hypothetical protein